MRNHSIWTTEGQRTQGVESRLLGKATERQVTVELGLEDSRHVDGGQGWVPCRESIPNRGTSRKTSRS